MGVLGAPRQAEQFILPQVLEDHLQRHLAHQARPPGKPGGRGKRLRRHRRAGQGACLGFAVQLAPQLAPGFLVQPLQQRAALGLIDQGIYGRQAFKGVLAVEHPGRIRLAALGIQNAPAKAPVDGCAAHQHRDVQPAPLQLVDDQRHLLAGVDQQGAQPDGIGVAFGGPGDDRLGRHLLA